LKKAVIYFLLPLLVTGCGFLGNRGKSNVHIQDSSAVFVYLPTQANMNTLLEAVKKPNAIIDFPSFEKYALSKNLSQIYRPGKYQLKEGMTNYDLIKLFKSGKREEVKLTFHYARTIYHLAGKLHGKLEADSTAFANFWSNTSKMKELYGVEKEQIPMIFIPNTYNFYWNTNAKEFTDKVFKEYEKFWNEDRKAKAKNLGLSPTQVVTLASIVQSEQSKYSDEWPIIAKLYLNRIKAGMMLQADPTVIYAMGDFTITRVLEKHLSFDSPYNTYLHTGLPPGPIMITEGNCIDAVLNPDNNDYIYMCAKEDFSGRHNFTASYSEHEKNASKYRKALSKLERSR
jgi:UPF0755 protein